MKLYNYNDFGVFTHESEARRHPLDPSFFITPAKATNAPLPPYNPGTQFCRFIESEKMWEVLEIPVEEPKLTPTETVHLPLIDKVKAERLTRLSEADIEVNKAEDIGSKPMIKAWRAYRQALRDITLQEGFPDTFTWPTKP